MALHMQTTNHIDRYDPDTIYLSIEWALAQLYNGVSLLISITDMYILVY
jgi:hypothetical protein